MNDIIDVPEEDRSIVIVEAEWTIDVPEDYRVIEVERDMPLLGSKPHTAGDTKRWTVRYGRWLANTATIEQFTAVPDNPDFTIGNIQILGVDAIFFLSGGLGANDQTTVTLTMTDSLTNIKHDTVVFTAVAP